MIIALITSLRERGHSSEIWLDSSIIDSSCGNNSSMPKYFASSYTPLCDKRNKRQKLRPIISELIHWFKIYYSKFQW